MIIKWPTEEEVDQSARFRTYVNYLTVLRKYMEGTYPDPAGLIQPIAQGRDYKRIQAGRCTNEGLVKQLLRNAWFTEIQMHLVDPSDELAPYCNHWAPVQLYYAVYLAVRAFFVASGRSVRENHTTTLASLDDTIASRSSLFPRPWNILCTGDPGGTGVAFSGLASGEVVQPVSPLAAPQTTPFLNSFGMLLRTTRERQVNQRVDSWKKQRNRKRILAKERAVVVKKIPPTSLFDAIYRLRIRSNYQDADSFLLSLEDRQEGRNFNVSLRTIGWHTLLVLESLIARYITRPRYGEIVADFAKYEKLGASKQLVSKRWGVLERCMMAAAV